MGFFIEPRGDSTKRRKGDTFDAEYIAEFMAKGKKHLVVVNDEMLENDDVLITVTQKAWREMGSRG